MHPAMAARKAPARLKLDPDDRPIWHSRGQGEPKPEKPAKPPKRPRRWLRRLGYAGAILGVWGVIALGLAVAYYAHDLPDVGKLSRIERRPNVTLAAADGTTLANFGDLYGEWLPLDAIPQALVQAVLATEDRRFYSHPGVDAWGLVRAAYANLRAGRAVQGGSTITQQLAKNVFLTGERTVKRKVQELMLALWLERRFSKDEILTLYLNRVYFGSGSYGVDAAARRYFEKSGRQVTLPEAALLAGLLKAPTRLSPANAPQLAQARARLVLNNMVEAEVLGAGAAKAAQQQLAKLTVKRPAGQGARYFADWVLDQLNDLIDAPGRDLLVLTTLDPKLQRMAEQSVEAGLARDGERLDVEQSALVAMTPEGAIRAMVGGRNYLDSQFNRATQAMRQPGSAFKLFVYLAALEAGIRPEDGFPDAPIKIGKWEPRNYTPGYAGQVSVRESLAKSINTVAVRLSEQVGRSRVRDAAARLGVVIDGTPTPAIALGAYETTLLALTGAYATMADNGIPPIAHGVLEVRDTQGQVLYRRQGSGAGHAVSPVILGQLDSMLQGVMREGTGRGARLDRPAAGKTGTTSDYRDAWFVGYTADLVAGVWVGNDDASAMNKVTGGGLPAQIWKDFMAQAATGQPPRELPAQALALTASTSRAPVESSGGGLLDRIGRFLSGGGGEASGSKPSRNINDDPTFRHTDRP
jgi:penicillin-binding protein 1A